MGITTDWGPFLGAPLLETPIYYSKEGAILVPKLTAPTKPLSFGARGSPYLPEKRPTQLGSYSILFYSILFYSIPILFYSILFCSILFYSILFCSILLYSIISTGSLERAWPENMGYFQ